MSTFARVTHVSPLGGRRLSVTFSDGLVRELDFSGVLIGTLLLIDDDETFAAARVDETAGTVSWANGIDLDPDVLHGDLPAASGIQPLVVREYRLQQLS
jgi:hypothetical protein